MSDGNNGRTPGDEITTEDINRAIRAGNDINKWLQGIAGDLWNTGRGVGAPASGPTEEAAAVRTRPAGAVPERARTPERATEKAPVRREKADPKAKAEPGQKRGTPDAEELNRLWRSADITVEWTDALGHDRPKDGLTSQREWDLYHRLAPRVLEGEIDAYVEVLTTLNPLGDLREYVNGMIIRTPGADRLECSFECRGEILKEDGQLYLGALAVRIARDLFAALPVSEVYVEGNQDGQRRVGVTFQRAQIGRKQMGFRDPAEYVLECGGLINTD